LTESVPSPEQSTVYRVEGFTCANCAGKFERNVKRLPGVVDARVNFGASKITVVGSATVEDLEHAGAFEKLKVRPERSKREAGKPSSDFEGTGSLSVAVAPGEQHVTATDMGERHERIKQSFLERHIILLSSALFLLIGYVSLFANGEHNVVTTLLFAASILIGGASLFKTGLQNLLRLEFDMRTLMTVAIIGAAIIGEWAEGAVVVILFAFSESLERYSMDRARQSIRSLMNIAPREALVRKDGHEMTKRVEDIEVGDIIIVKPGQKIAMDGIVASGRSAVNQAAITGESVPVDKSIGDEVFAGTLNEEGLLEVRVTKLVDDTTIAKIIHLVEEAQGERAPAQAFVDRFAKVYTPIIMIIAAIVAIVPPLFGGDWSTYIYQGLSVLVVGCPCALVISTPISIVSAIGTAARNGVLIKGGIYLEELGALKAVAFDKTGTLTRGVPTVTEYKVFDVTEHTASTDIAGRETEAPSSHLFAIIGALEHRSQHPLASAVVRWAEREGWPYEAVIVEDFTSLTGRGIQGKIDGVRYYVGNAKLYEELAIKLTEEQQAYKNGLQQAGKTVMIAGTEQGVCAIIAVADEVRGSSARAVRGLHQLGIQHTVMLTGDNEATARAIAMQTGVTEVRAELMPEDKLHMIKRLRADYGKVAMIGDGVNDAPALAASTVGIAMGGAGTDTALETADVALMGDDLEKLPFAVRLSRQALAIIKQNIAFSLAIKLVALLLVVPGWLTLWIAIASDMGATLIVALNGMRLMRGRSRR